MLPSCGNGANSEERFAHRIIQVGTNLDEISSDVTGHATQVTPQTSVQTIARYGTAGNQ